MAGFEERVSNIFHNETKLKRHFAHIIPQIFNLNEREFQRQIKSALPEDDSDELVLLYDIVIHDYFFEEIDDWFLSWVIQKYANRFSSEELEEMSAQAESFLDFYQVIDVEPGVGSTLQALHSGNIYDLKDVNTSSALTKWDVIMLRCYPYSDAYYMTGVVHVFLPDDKRLIEKRLTQEFTKYIEKYNDENFAHFAKDEWATILNIARDVHENRKSPKVFTNYGEFNPKDIIFSVQNFENLEEIFFNNVEFELIKTEEKRGRKKKNQMINRHTFNWLSLGQETELDKVRVEPEGVIVSMTRYDSDGKNTNIESIGRVAIDKEIVRFTVYSEEIVEYVKEKFQRLYPDLLKFKRVIKAKFSDEQFPPDQDEEPDPISAQQFEKKRFRA